MTAAAPSNPGTLNLPLDEMIQSLQRDVQRALDLVSFGLRAAVTTHETPLTLPGVFAALTPSKATAMSPAEAKEEFPIWLLGHGFRDCVEALNHLLDSAWFACSLLAWGPVAVGGPITRDLGLSGKAGRKFHRLFLPQKIESMRHTFGEQLIHDGLATCILSINKARACLVHRRGLVQAPDLDPDGRLIVTWRRLEMEIMDRSGAIRSARERPSVEPGESVRPRFVAVEREMNHGERISFTPEEFLEIALTCIQFGQELCRNVITFSESKGLRVEGAERLQLGTDVTLILRPAEEDQTPSGAG